MQHDPHKTTKPEILAPAGSMESLVAAVRSGATAVYLGGQAFSARAAAHNFDRDALRQAVEYCHVRGVAVHLAVNTLLLEDELPAALEFAAFACSLPVDAIIVQDVGLFSLLRRCAPDLPLHASTQMSVHSPAGARLLAAQGMRRVVLSRELSLDEIREISAAVPVELEHFVHGALCMSVSGQCYFSAMLGSRSGNRGMCAQPCRLPFAAPEGTGYDLSLKDLSLIDRIDELAQAGVSSCKIEGRMKRPEYVAAATAACTFAERGEAIPGDLRQNLYSVFSRSGFTTGYADGERGREMFGVRTKQNVTDASQAVFSQLHSLYKGERPCVPVSFRFTAQAGKPCSLTVQDEDGHTVTREGPVPEPAQNRPLDAARCRAQLEKTGGTPFFCTRTDCEIADGLALPASALNHLRRDCLDALTEQRKHRPPIPFSCGEIPSGKHRPETPLRWRARFARVRESTDIPPEAEVCEWIYVPLGTPLPVLADLRRRGLSVALEMPRGMFGTEPAVRRQLEQAAKAGFCHVWAGNLGAVGLARELGLSIHGGFSLNAVNTAALEWLEQLGLEDTELSLELTLAQARHLGGNIPRGIQLYGRLPLMLCRNCPAANAPGGCKGCEARGGSRPAVLTDRKGETFPIQCFGGCSEILNCVPLSLSDRIHEIQGQDFGVFRFTVENSVEIGEIFSAFQSHTPLKGPYTRGLSYRGIQ